MDTDQQFLQLQQGRELELYPELLARLIADLPLITDMAEEALVITRAPRSGTLTVRLIGADAAASLSAAVV